MERTAESARVLVADDDPLVAQVLARILMAHGHVVTIAPDGLAAAEALLKDRFDVVLSDVHMPNMSGVQLLSLVREYDLDVPVILLTGSPDLESAVDALKLGAMEYLTKPWKSDVILASVSKATKLHALARLKREAMTLLGESPGAGDLAGLSVAFAAALESLSVCVQPVVDYPARRVIGYECLLRSESSVLATPTAILDAAERLGRLHDVGRRARRFPSEMLAQHPLPTDDVMVFVNLHLKDLLDEDLYRDTAPLSRIASRVILELTERSAFEGLADLRDRIAALRKLGFRIALDDLGAGYAGLSTLAVLEPDFVKFDMSLIQGIHASLVRQRIVMSMASTCRDLGMVVIVEGVEKPEDRDLLLTLGCQLMQGYLFAAPALPYPQTSW